MNRIVWAGSIAGALIAISTVAGPPLKAVVGGPFPLASTVELAQLADKLQQLQRGIDQNTAQQAQNARNQQIQTMNLWMGQLFQLRLQAGPNPNPYARQQIQQTLDFVNGLRAQLGLPPIR